MTMTLTPGIDAEESYETIQVSRIGGSLGAVVSGVDPRDNLTDQQFAEIHQALLRHEVIFFRNVPMSAEAQLELATRWGQPSIYPLQALMGGTEPNTSIIRDDADSLPTTDNWHTDVTWIDVPPKVALLQSLVSPPLRRRHHVVQHHLGLRRPVGTDAGHDRRAGGPPLQLPPVLHQHG